MVSIDPCDSFSSSSARVRTGCSLPSAEEMRRKSRASSRMEVTSASRQRRRSRRWRATSACRKATFSTANTAMKPACPGKAAAAPCVAPGPKAMMASNPRAAAASGQPTGREWKVTRKLTKA